MIYMAHMDDCTSAAPTAMSAPRRTSAPMTSHASTLCWQGLGTWKCPNSNATTNMLSTPRLFLTIQPCN